MHGKKTAETREEELLKAAGELFLQKGYEDTSVNSIVKSIGVSKGTFYYYFDSKEDLVDDLVEKISEPIYRKIDAIISDDSFSAVEKLNRIFTESTQIKLANKEQVRRIFSLVYKPENLQLRNKIQNRTVEKSAKKTVKIIKQGVEEGILNTQFPEEVSRLIFWMGMDLGEEMATRLLDPEAEAVTEKYIREYRAYENAIERVLGAPEGSIDFLDEEDLTEFLSYLNRSDM
ncbi:MAG: TetR/AcrR family transcriptional regulator [Candidatus Acetothermia bacterium]